MCLREKGDLMGVGGGRASWPKEQMDILNHIMKMGHQIFEDKACVILFGKQSSQAQYLSGNTGSVNVCWIELDKPFNLPELQSPPLKTDMI